MMKILFPFTIVLIGLALQNYIVYAEKVNCLSATVMLDFNADRATGEWYEVLRYPAADGKVACVALNLTLTNQTMTLSTTYSDTSDLSKNQTSSTNITLTDGSGNSTGYNVSYAMNPSSVMYKILSTDYTNYALLCGYTNATNSSTTFGIVLSRERLLNTTQLNQYETLAQKDYTDFGNSSTGMDTIIQSERCYTNSAMATVFPTLATMISLICILRKYII